MLTLVIGGSASGKSEYAERHVTALPGERIYIATMQPWDEECLARIAKHQKARAHRGFATIECYRDLDRLRVPEGSNVLLECLSNLLANEYFACPVPTDTEIGSASADVIETTVARVMEGIRSLRAQCSHLTIVSNEIFSGGSDYEGDTLGYMKALGLINRALAAEADRVVEVVCGLPDILKGA